LPNHDSLSRADWTLLILFSLGLFGFSLFGWRPMTMHEGVLPQTARTMLADHDWVVPKNGDRPWLESPPLPQWITVAVASVFGRCDTLWIVRIPPALAGTACVLMTAWMASVFFGRRVGLLAGCVHATMYEIAQYSWLAEDEIFLCALVTASVACFVHIEFSRGESLEPGSRSFVGLRTRRLAVLFALLGLTNLAKGLLFGTVMSLVPIAAFLLGTRDMRRILFYFWLPGWALFALIAAAWPFAAWLRFPDVTQVWWYDHGGRLDGHYADITQPWYYYLKLLPTIIAPWIALVPWSATVTWRKAWEDRSSAERFVWGWAILVPLVFSIPTGKHHHYMLHAVTPWSILTAFGLARLYAVLQTGPAWLRNPWPALGTIGLPVAAALWLTRHKTGLSTEHLVLLSLGAPLFGVLLAWGLTQSRPRLAGGFLFGLVASGFLGGHVAAGKWFDQSRHDAVFLSQVREYVGDDKTLVINGATRSLDEFRFQFSQSNRAKVVHNLSFLRDANLPTDEVLVLARARDADALSEYGTPEIVLQSERTRREKSPMDRWSLFRLAFHPGLERVAATGIRVSPMQAMQRADGPFLSPAGLVITDHAEIDGPVADLPERTSSADGGGPVTSGDASFGPPGAIGWKPEGRVPSPIRTAAPDGDRVRR
jgi:4-amino-4-deoxy-L-arabinose transferase-like glycosyltransferase